MLKLAIFTDLDFVHFYQVPYYWYFQAVYSKKVPPELLNLKCNLWKMTSWKLLTKIHPCDNIYLQKSATVQQRFASVYGSKKATYTLVGAVALLMLSFLTGLHDTDHGHDDADHRNYNTDSANHCFYHLCTFR